MKRGIALVTLVTVIVILSILGTTLTVSAVRSINNSKLYTFAKELKTVQDFLDAYMSENNNKVPSKGTYEIQLAGFTEENKLEIFNGETITGDKLELVKLDLYELGISTLSRGKEETPTDMYAYSEQTKRVYYVKGVTIGSKQYYRLTDDLLKVLGIATTATESSVLKDGILTYKFPSYYTNLGVTIVIKLPKDTLTNTNVTSNVATVHVTKTEDEKFNIYTLNDAADKYKQKYSAIINYKKDGATNNLVYIVDNADNVKPTLEYSGVEFEYNIEKDTTDTRITGLKVTDDLSGVKCVKYFDGNISDGEVQKTMRLLGEDVNIAYPRVNVKNPVFVLYVEDNAGNYTFARVQNSQGLNNKINPSLRAGLTPVKFDESNHLVDTTSDDATWFDYSNKRWANARSNDGSLWVWIPRFAYKIENPGNSEASKVKVIILRGNTNQYIDELGNLRSLPRGYIVHPAFTKQYEIGGYSKEISGFWVSKFEAGYPAVGNLSAIPKVESDLQYTSVYNSVSNPYGSIITITSIIFINPTKIVYPVLMANANSYNNIAIGDAYAICRDMNRAGNPYGFSATMATHLIKNTEWGAVLYFAAGGYGIANTKGTDKTVSGQSQTQYYTGINEDGDLYNAKYETSASTSGNVYGVFDMSGASYEFVSGHIKNDNQNLVDYGKIMYLDERNSNTKIKTVYNFASEEEIAEGYVADTSDANYVSNANSNRKGEAIFETSNGTSAWYGGRMIFPQGEYPFMTRGGTATLPDGTAYTLLKSSGAAESTTSFRPVIVSN